MGKATKPHSEMMMTYLRDREAAVAYLKAAEEEGEEVLLRARREVAMAESAVKDNETPSTFRQDRPV